MRKVLILGGTQFIGRNLVERLKRIGGYDITLFNRQQTQVDLFPEIKKIKGDRETDDVNQLANKNWDFVIDVSCYYPNSLSSVLKEINKDLYKYIFVSTCSVYDNDDNQAPLKDEQAKILSCSDNQRVDRNIESYGNRKAEAERMLQESGLNYLILRPSLVYGKYDHTDRFYYWLYQVKHNDFLFLPDNGDRKISLTYVHDIVDVIVDSLTNKLENDIYNVISSPKVGIREIVEHATDILHKKNELISAPVAFLKKNNISQWADMPLWLDGDFFTHSNHKFANDFELKLTDLKKSIEETINYYSELGWPDPKCGLTEKRRVHLLDKLMEEKGLDTKKTL